MKLICSFVLLRHLFWFTRQLIRISWTCGTRNELCKFRQKIKWIGLENRRINTMRLKRHLRSTYSWLYLNLTLWRVSFACNGWPGGKELSTIFRKSLPIFEFKFLRFLGGYYYFYCKLLTINIYQVSHKNTYYDEANGWYHSAKLLPSSYISTFCFAIVCVTISRRGVFCWDTLYQVSEKKRFIE